MQDVYVIPKRVTENLAAQMERYPDSQGPRTNTKAL